MRSTLTRLVVIALAAAVVPFASGDGPGSRVALTGTMPAAVAAAVARTISPPRPFPADAVATAANGDPIYTPGSSHARAVTVDGRSVRLPANTVLVPAGPFTMGDRDDRHRVELDAFAIGTYLVTNAEWKAYLDATGSGDDRPRGHGRSPRSWSDGTYPEGKGNHPVLWVSWTDATQYCQYLSRKGGFTYALPTEAQWEKAARGTQAYRFPWGNQRDASRLNYNGLCARALGLTVSADGEVHDWHPTFTDTTTYAWVMSTGGYTTPVGAFPTGASPCGAMDMAGNAYEWCQDWYAADYASLPDAGRNPAGPTRAQADDVREPGYTGPCKVIRGGSSYGHLSSGQTTNRQEKRNPTGGYHSVGFRVAVLLTPRPARADDAPVGRRGDGGGPR